MGRAITADGLSVPGFPVEYGGSNDPGANLAGFETLGHGDLSLLVKFGVQFGLFGGSIQHSAASATTSATCARSGRWSRPAALP
ncbi:MAG TPA: hypothetical protein VG321_05940 [Solirubrobacteraceae bacterium]|nr:hypothetical protein [Solirubrobacteraceae bacterium]